MILSIDETVRNPQSEQPGAAAGGMTLQQQQRKMAAAGLGGLFEELRGGMAAVLGAGRRAAADVVLLYSPESFRLDWLLRHRAGEDAWT